MIGGFINIKDWTKNGRPLFTMRKFGCLFELYSPMPPKRNPVHVSWYKKKTNEREVLEANWVLTSSPMTAISLFVAFPAILKWAWLNRSSHAFCLITIIGHAHKMAAGGKSTLSLCRAILREIKRSELHVRSSYFWAFYCYFIVFL